MTHIRAKSKDSHGKKNSRPPKPFRATAPADSYAFATILNLYCCSNAAVFCL